MAEPTLPPLGAPGLTARASGKTILVGEHAVVYGHPALALALPDVDLEIRLGEPIALPRGEAGAAACLAAWERGVEVSSRGTRPAFPSSQRSRVVEGFERALRAVGACASLSARAPQALVVESRIPLGAGMGGSAAMSTAFVRLALRLRNEEWPAARVAEVANDIDALFHGKASGLDAAAVSSDGIIHFVRGREPTLVRPAVGFHLVLVDCGERAATSDMVGLVARRLQERAPETRASLDALGLLTQRSREALEAGDLAALGAFLTRAHEHLRDLGVSTPRMDALRDVLLAKGALGAKLTGAGGGGLVLALFARDPASLLGDLRTHGEVFTTYIRG